MARSEQESHVSNKQRAVELEERSARIRTLNDGLRRLRLGGRFMLTAGVQALGQGALVHVLRTLATFDSFDRTNDPYDEHDFGSIRHGGHVLFWKIDYYDKTLEYGSPDPADPDVTARVLTIMLAEEY